MKNKIIKIVSDQLNIDLMATANHRKRNYVYARAIYYKITRDLTVESLADIGKPLNKNHATVVHALNVVFSNIEMYEPDMLSVYNACKEIALDEIRKSKKHELSSTRKSISEVINLNKILRAELEQSNAEISRLKMITSALDPTISNLIGRVTENNRELFIERLDAMTKMLPK